jgi:3,4-dihydroxy-2-butanone 4-phosphate synthase
MAQNGPALVTGRSLIAAAVAASMTGSAGRSCTKPGSVFVLDGPDADVRRRNGTPETDRTGHRA